MKYFKIVLKADTEGSLEAVKQAIEKIEAPNAKPKIIHAAVGSVTETDVMMAAASQGVVFGFHTLVSPRIKRIAEKEQVEIQNYDIIYKLTEDVEQILTGLLQPELIGKPEIGTLVVKEILLYLRKKLWIGGVGRRLKTKGLLVYN